MSKHHHPKETPPVLSKPEGQTDFLRKKLARWTLVIKWCLTELRMIILGIVSLVLACGAVYNHHHATSLHETTQQQIAQMRVEMSNIEVFVDYRPNSVGLHHLTNSPDIAKVIP